MAQRRRDRIRAAFDEFHAAAGAALGAADRLSERASRAHAETLAELWLRQESADATSAPGLSVVRGSARLSDVVGRLDAEQAAAFAEWRRDAPPRLSALVDGAAPGPAGDEPQTWLGRPGTVEGTGPVPGLWQLGAGEAPGGGEPFRVGVPLLDEAHLQVRSTALTRAQAESMVEMLVLRVLGYFRPGLVGVHVWDVGRFAGSLPGLYPLTRTGLLSVHDPAALGRLLGQLSERIRRVRTRVLARGHSSLRSVADAEGTRAEPWVLVVLLGNRQALGDEEHRQLQRVARDGTSSGVSLILLDVPATLHGPVETVRIDDPPEPGAPAPVHSSMTGDRIVVRPDPPVAVERLVEAANAIAGEHERWRGRLGAFADLLPGAWGEESSQHGVVAPVGFDDGMPIVARLDDSSPHALVGGPSGSGKTNLLLAWISAMAARYDPDELELYLLDFKEGVSFAQFAPGRRDPRWLPQARLVGVNVNTDREFGLALLRFLSDELRERAEAAKRHEVTKLAELREVDRDGRWPRIVAVIDEFQYLFLDGGEVTREATALLEDILRRGRSQGIHLVFASQDVSGIQAFWGRPAIMEQFVLRIALPRARRILADLNDASLELPRWHAVVNHESGIRHGNETARVPDATARDAVDTVRGGMFDLAVAQAGGVPARPVVFDGARAPHHRDLPLPVDAAAPVALLGQAIDVAGSAAAVELAPVPGRNVAVIAPTGPDAMRVLGAAVSTLGARVRSARFLLAPLVAEAGDPSKALGDELREAGHDDVETVGLEEIGRRIAELADEVRARLNGEDRSPTFLVLYAADAAEGVLDRSGAEALRTVLHHGPETGVHALGWWRGVERLRTQLGSSRGIDDIGAWVAIDVPGTELGGFTPGLAPTWSPRPGRGLYFDRARTMRPEILIVPGWP